MTHKPIIFDNIRLSFPQKVCFDNFSTQLHHGARVGLIGSNGSGKSSLLRMIQGINEIEGGHIHIPSEMHISYVPQHLPPERDLSGGEALFQRLRRAFEENPDVLLLDEPTNHLDQRHRHLFAHHLQRFPGTVILATHDVAFLKAHTSEIWSICEGRIDVFSGSYDDYVRERNRVRTSLEAELRRLSQAEKEIHQRRMKEQERAANSRASGEKKLANRRWMKSTGDLKAMKAEKSQGSKGRVLREEREDLKKALSQCRLPERIVPTFYLSPKEGRERELVRIDQGAVSYDGHSWIMDNIHFVLRAGERMVISGENGSGKTTFIKAIMAYPDVITEGKWMLPCDDEIGYLDQHYDTLSKDSRVIGIIQASRPEWSHNDCRKHLNDFLFRKNEEVYSFVETLSGGERSRLCLAKIAACPPELLILDEPTNNLDLETKQHLLDVLKAYPGAFILISHDGGFVAELEIEIELKMERASCD